METVKKKRKRRGSKPKIENHYKVLGLRSNSRPEKIKQKYIEMVKQYPPEQYPDEFEQIRKAYETLKDPIKRQEYDLMRKYGDSLEETMNTFVEFVDSGKYDQAEKLLTDMLKVAPDLPAAYFGLAQLYVMQDDLDRFENQMQILLEKTKAEEEQVGVLAIKAKMLIESGHPDEAADVLDLLKRDYAKYADTYRMLQIEVYIEQDRADEALQLFELEAPQEDDSDPDHIFFFIAWIDTMFEAEKWDLSDKIKKRVRKFFRLIYDETDRFMIASALIDEYEYYAEGDFRAALFYIDLLHSLDPKHPFVLENRAKARELSNVEKELHRLLKDDELFPLVAIQALTWFYEERDLPEVAADQIDMLPQPLMQQMELMDEEYAIGIKRVQKKYPVIYRRYKERWTDLFEEKTAGLNREARRRLK